MASDRDERYLPDGVAEDTLRTPEGDGEGAGDRPLMPTDVAVERPRGSEPHFQLPVRKALG